MLLDRKQNPTFEGPQYIDNFLSKREYDIIKDLVMDSGKCLFFPNFSVAHRPSKNSNHEPWNWYGTHSVYRYDYPNSELCDTIYNTFVRKFYKKEIMSCLMRIKVNFYPWTETLQKHDFHVDYDAPNHGALFSVNTCDGYTEFEDGTKIDSVANRLMFFNPQVKHRSTTTTTAYGRFNINFNFK
tara:strand:+ start:210 stop:761 length:552 start_codon:yes stop_codon:yes gene_type:complete